eukprot:TRINITY_DN6922_c0_g1_i1.p1 TRINITY_DN6922_c0_g1~~TRINITY_DN6922_c0_g1_i1.p1  ORF type:complete len:581 (+),score=129.10 TRINITY_DN6922_c0_g1_i1:250-1743(+)
MRRNLPDLFLGPKSQVKDFKDEEAVLIQAPKHGLQVSITSPVRKRAESNGDAVLDEVFAATHAKAWSKDWDSYKKMDGCWQDGPRNFLEYPVLVIAPALVNGWGTEICDIPCFSTNEQSGTTAVRGDSFIKFDLGGHISVTPPCRHQRKAHLSMESAKYYPANYIPGDAATRHDLHMTVQLMSNVTVGYYSWIEYDIMSPVNFQQKEKNEALGAAFISNCGGDSGRLSVLQGLMENGVKIDSYGACLRNKNEGGRGSKVDAMRDYKFGMAFENTVWEDYVTEKLFQVFVAGAIPIVVGAPNSHDFEPLPETMLYDKDFPTVADLAKKVLEIANNETLFRHYLRYKTSRPSDKFLALYDISAAHSRCRMCIKMADLMDEEWGEYSYGESSLRSIDTGITIRVRERNKYFFQDVHLEDLTYAGLMEAIITSFKAANHQPVWRNNRPKVLDTEAYRIYRIYKFHPHQTMWDTLHNNDNVIDSDKAVRDLRPLERIEVILV